MWSCSRWLTVLAILFTACGEVLSADASVPAHSGRELVPELLVVVPRQGLRIEGQAEQALGAAAAELRKQGQVVVRTTADKRAAAEKALLATGQVAKLLPVFRYRATAVPDDPRYPFQYHHPRIGSPEAWDRTTGSSSIVVAVLDTGVDATHPDLQGKVLAGFNFFDDNTDTTDAHGHGTMVAGTAAAIGNNGLGLAGASWASRILPVRIAGAEGFSYSTTIAAAVRWAADQGARVINCSFGPLQGDQVIEEAAAYARGRGSIVFVSAGNSGSREPAAGSSNIVFVSATGPDDQLTSWSTYGPSVSLSAPGLDIYTTTMGGGYAKVSGTSFSSPLSAGVAALMLAENPALTPAQVRRIMSQTAVDLGAPGWDERYGHGRVNAGAAVAAAAGGGGALTLSQALDAAGVTWSTAGSAAWTAQDGTTHDGLHAAQSGAIAHDQESALSTTIAGPAQLTFWWRVSSQPDQDVLLFEVDGQELRRISGETGWTRRAFEIPTGEHVIRWRYTKDGSGVAGQDAGWVDQVEVSARGAPDLAEALDSPALAWLTEGYSIWSGQTATAHDGADAAQVGAILDGMETTLSTTVSGPATVSFWWKAASLPGRDILSLELDDQVQERLSGDQPWERSGIQVPPGTHLVRWRYEKQRFYDWGAPDAAWVDEVSVGAPLAISLEDALDAASVTWSTTGSSPWAGQPWSTHDGVDAARSGLIADGGRSILETTVVGPATVSFRWRVSSEAGFDFLSVELDDQVLDRISGEVGWEAGEIHVPSGAHTVRWQYAKDEFIESGHDAGWVDAVTVGAPGAVPSLQEALDAPSLAWSSGGDAAFAGQTLQSHDGVDAAKSGGIADGQQSTLSTTVTGPAVVSFWWKVSSEPRYDFLRVDLDGAEQASISGEVGWQRVAIAVPDGAHDLRFRYTKDGTIAAGRDTGWVDEVSSSAGAPSLTLEEALDAASLTFATGGASAWRAQLSTTHDGVDAARSGPIADSQECTLSTTVTGPAALSFWWRVSSEEAYDFLTFEVDGQRIAGISGEVGWEQHTLSIPAGEHVLRWRYEKDSIFSGGEDAAWVDQVSLGAPPPPPSISLAEALDAPGRTFTTGVNAWAGQAQVTHDGTDAARSAPIGDNGQSALETTITGPATVSFWWRVSSERGWDFLNLELDDVVVQRISGDVGWRSLAVRVPAGSHTVRWRYEKDYVYAEGEDAGWVDQVLVEPAAETGVSLEEALDGPSLTWVTAGAAPWSGQVETTHDGVDAAQSGAIGHGQTSSMATSITGPATVKFRWKVSSEKGCDVLRVDTGGWRWNQISGETGWQQATVPVPAGTSTVRWSYIKDEVVAGGQDAGWVDEVSIHGVTAAPTITSAAEATGLLGAPFSYQIEATDFPSYYYANPLPPGLTLDNFTGRISGVPAAAGTFPVQLFAWNVAGWSSPHVLTLAIVAPPDLELQALELPQGLHPGDDLSVRARVANRGSGAAGASTLSFQLLSLDGVASGPALGAVAVPALGAGGSAVLELTARITGSTVPATYLVAAAVAPADGPAELDETNNVTTSELAVVGEIHLAHHIEPGGIGSWTYALPGAAPGADTLTASWSVTETIAGRTGWRFGTETTFQTCRATPDVLELLGDGSSTFQPALVVPARPRLRQTWIGTFDDSPRSGGPAVRSRYSGELVGAGTLDLPFGKVRNVLHVRLETAALDDSASRTTDLYLAPGMGVVKFVADGTDVRELASAQVGAMLERPLAGAVLDGGEARFSWFPGVEATAYRLSVGTPSSPAAYFARDMGTTRGVTVTDLPTDGRLLTVRLETQLGGAWASRPNTYELRAAALPRSIRLTAPNGGETFTEGQRDVPVTWTYTGDIPQVEVWLGRRSGTTYFDWRKLAGPIANDGNETFDLPAGATGSNWVFFVGPPDYAVSDVSDGNFGIQVAPDMLSLTAPDGGETFAEGQQGVRVSWTSSGSIAQVELWMGRRNGTTFSDWRQLTGPITNDGEQVVNLPAGAVGSDWVFYVGTPDYAVFDTSSSAVTIQGSARAIAVTAPDGGETFAEGQQGVRVSWTSSGAIAQVELWMGRRSGTTFSDWRRLAGPIANDGQEDVNLPAGAAGSDWVFYVGTPDYAVFDTSNGTVTIQGSARTITVTAPDGGQTFAEGQQGVRVSWTSSGAIAQVELWLGRRNGTTFSDWRQLTGPITNDGQEDVRLPAGAVGSNWVFYVGTPDYAVFDTSDGTVTIQDPATTITLTAPNGGETFTAGQQGVRVTWTSSPSIPQVELWLGRRDGSTFSDWRRLAGPIANDGQEDVALPPGATGSNWVFYVSPPDYSVYDVSDGSISIVAP